MLYQKRRKKLNQAEPQNKKNQDSTQNSDRITSQQRTSQLSRTKKKSFTKIFNKRTFNPSQSSKQPSKQKYSSFKSRTKEDLQVKDHQTNNNYGEPNQNKQETLSGKKQSTSIQKMSFQSNTYSTCSLQANGVQQPGLNANRKKFRLYCEVKKKKNQKKSQNQKQGERYAASSTVSESWIKNSIFSGTSQKRDSNSTNRSKNKGQLSSRKKINITQKIRQLKSRQKYSAEKDHKLNQKIPQLDLKDKDNFTKASEQSSKRSKKSQEKKHSTLNIKRSVILQKLHIQQSNLTHNSQRSQKQEVPHQSPPQIPQEKQLIAPMKKSATYTAIENKILPQDSEILQQTVKKLSEIREEKNEDTISRSISRSLKPHEIHNIDHSTSKNNEQTSLHLSINSICKDNRRSFGCILQTTELRQSALRREIESSLSELQKSRQKINIQKFKQPKTIGQMGSEISRVQQNMTVIEKIEFHIELINTLSNFVYKSTELQYLMQDWDQLNFLIYKKFYIERMKVLNFLKKYPIKNPFCIKRASIQTKQILKALRQNQLEIKRIKQMLQKQNSTIKKNLEVFYNQFSQDQHGQKINLFEYDNFSHWIYKELWDQIQLFSYSQSHNQSQLQDRICKSLQAGFLIAELNGNYVTPFEDAQIAAHQNNQKVYIDDNLKLFERYVLNKKK